MTQKIRTSINVVALTLLVLLSGGCDNSPPALVSLSLTPADGDMAVGHSTQFTATGTYADGSTEDVTSMANP